MTTHQITGGCRCGAIRYEIAPHERPLAYACHCTDCQTWSGSAFSEQLLVREQDFSLSGDPARFDLAGSGGRVSHQRACARCFTRVFNTNTGRPGFVVVRAGTLDDSSGLVCAAHIWTRSKQPWLMLSTEVPTWEEGAPSGALEEALDATSR